ncbi:hypothetical protein BS78_01G224200 [Paspalum vaginatum]|nr:hypothetical protein BS78_01G224200 [Paspalum vaginatum]
MVERRKATLRWKGDTTTFQRKHVLLVLILILAVGAQATTIVASRVLRPQGGSSASLTASKPGASGCTFDPNNPGGRCPHP